MKSITIKDKNGLILLKIVHKKNGEFDMEYFAFAIDNFDIQVRDNDNSLVYFKELK